MRGRGDFPPTIARALGWLEEAQANATERLCLLACQHVQAAELGGEMLRTCALDAGEPTWLERVVGEDLQGGDCAKKAHSPNWCFSRGRLGAWIRGWSTRRTALDSHERPRGRTRSMRSRPRRKRTVKHGGVAGSVRLCWQGLQRTRSQARGDLRDSRPMPVHSAGSSCSTNDVSGGAFSNPRSNRYSC
jgi:hypothetical protein